MWLGHTRRAPRGWVRQEHRASQMQLQNKVKKYLKRKRQLGALSDPEQAPGTAVTELPDVDPPAACEPLASAPA
ncbi:hypothetical protein QTO34_009451, partial [Cnephaeus nilssonii]